MDFTPTGWAARYDGAHSDGIRWRSVEAWGGDGQALVADTARGCLVPARSMAGYTGLERVDRVVTAVPAQPGWTLRIWQTDDQTDDKESQFSVPIAAWLVTAAGQLIPIGGSSDSYLDPVAGTQQSEVMPPGDSTD